MMQFRSRLSFVIRIISIASLSSLLIFFVISSLGVPTGVAQKLFTANSWHQAYVTDLSLLERISQRIQTYELVKVVLKQNRNHPQNEIELIVQKLLPFKRLLLSQIQVKHHSTQNSSLVWGLGFCDQVNAVAAIALAQFFDRVEMVGVQGTEMHEGHSFGRVWLPKMREWVYFDLWPDDLFLLTANKTTGVHVLRRISSAGIEKTHSLSGNSEFIKIYRDLLKAQSYLAFPRTALGYLVQASIRGYLAHPTFHSVAFSVSSLASDSFSYEPSISPEKLKVYLLARREHIFGNAKEAAKLYKVFLSQAPPDSPFTRAAKIFSISSENSGTYSLRQDVKSSSYNLCK